MKRWILLTWIILGGGAGLLAAGCGSSDQQAAADRSAQGAADGAGANTNSAAAPSDPSLVGVWLGIGYLDEEILARKLAAIPDAEERELVQKMAHSFQSTRLGVEFRTDRQYELEMEIVTTGGEVLRGASNGTWEVTRQEDSLLAVQLTEHKPDGGVEVQETEYTFADADHFAFAAPVHPILTDCQPLIVFERQTGMDPTRAAQTRPTTGDAAPLR